MHANYHKMHGSGNYWYMFDKVEKWTEIKLYIPTFFCHKSLDLYDRQETNRSTMIHREGSRIETSTNSVCLLGFVCVCVCVRYIS